MKNRHLFAAATMLVPGPVAAQTIVYSLPEVESVADRLRPEFRPVGGRIGSFFLYPTFALTSGTTDNARADPDRVDDTFVLVAGDARLRSNWSVHSLNLQAFANHSIHTLETEDVTQYGGQVDGRLDVTREASFNVLIRAERLAEDRTNFANPRNAREPIRLDRLRAALGSTQALGRFALTTRLSYTSANYEDAETRDGLPISQRFRDVSTYGGAASIAYVLSPGYALVLSGAADRRDYDLSSSDPRQPGHINRDSSGGRMEAGVKLTIGSSIVGEVRGGYLVRNYADPRLLDTSGVSFGGNLLWNLSRLTSLRATVDRRVDETASTLAAGTRVTEASLRADHELKRNVILSGSARVAQLKPLSPDDATSSERGANLRGLYLINRLLSLQADYSHTQRSSPDPLLELRENRGTIGLRATF